MGKTHYLFVSYVKDRPERVKSLIRALRVCLKSSIQVSVHVILSGVGSSSSMKNYFELQFPKVHFEFTKGRMSQSEGWSRAAQIYRDQWSDDDTVLFHDDDDESHTKRAAYQSQLLGRFPRSIVATRILYPTTMKRSSRTTAAVKSIGTAIPPLTDTPTLAMKCSVFFQVFLGNNKDFKPSADRYQDVVLWRFLKRHFQILCLNGKLYSVRPPSTQIIIDNQTPPKQRGDDEHAMSFQVVSTPK